MALIGKIKNWRWLASALAAILVVFVGSVIFQLVSARRLLAQESDAIKLVAINRVRDLNEVSGIVLSPGNEKCFWMHNDSNGQAEVFLVGFDGKLKAVYRLPDAENRDWEDLCVAKIGRRNFLIVGDVGDNAGSRKECQLYLFEEPILDQFDEKEPSQKRVENYSTIHFTYSDGPRNCEAIGFDPNSNSVFLIEKKAGNAPGNDDVGVYSLDLSIFSSMKIGETSQRFTATRRATLPIRNVTALDFSPDGRRLIARDYYYGYLFQRKESESWGERLQGKRPAKFNLPVEAQGEAVCFDIDGQSLFVTSEFSRQPIWQMTIPASALVPQDQDKPKSEIQKTKPVLEIKNLILPGEAFEFNGHVAFIFWPEQKLRSEPQPWVFYGPTLPAYPDEHEKWMHQQFLSAGIAVAGIDVGEAYGSPESRRVFDDFYQHLIAEKKFSTKPCLLGRSRGGLWVSSWAADHPERFAGLACIYPVFDWRTYPGTEKAAAAYGLTPAELLKDLATLNPVSRMDRLAKARLPVFMIHGEDDEVVPLAENSATVARIYKDHGAAAAITLEAVPGQGHNYWEGFFRSQSLVDFVIKQAKAGAEPSESK
jgi:esterase/lipase superfamily enzyme